jgi:electron transfer flavoprotein beta subunit
MKIVVPVKQVAKLDDEYRFDGGASVERDYLDWDVNEWDNFSLEAALAIRDSLGDGAHEVVVTTVGPVDAEETLLSCLAKGADRAVRIWDGSLDEVDPLAVARVLASLIRSEAPDLVLCGVQSSDAAHGATGVAIAGYLDLTHAAVVTEIEFDPQAATATLARELEGGLVEVIQIQTPALLTVQTGINEPRYANLRAIKQARDKPMAVFDLAAIGLTADDVWEAAGYRPVSLSAAETKNKAEMLAGPPAAVAARIVEIVREGNEA